MKTNLQKVWAVAVIAMVITPTNSVFAETQTKEITKVVAQTKEVVQVVEEQFTKLTEEKISGCTDEDATNYNPAADIDNDSCEYPVLPEVPLCILNIEKTVDKTQASVGDELTYTFTVTSVGTADCTGGGVRAFDWLDKNFVYSGHTVTDNASAGYSNLPVYSASEHLVRFNAHTLEPSESATFTITGTIAAPGQCGDFEIKNKAKTTAFELNRFQTWVYSNEVQTNVGYECEPEVIEGCTDTLATNYNVNATENDHSCEYPVVVEEEVEVIEGCTDTDALNYNANATVNDDSCEYPAPAVEEPVVTRSSGGGSASPRCEITASSDVVFAGSDVTLTWDTRSTNEVTLTDEEGEVIFTTDTLLSDDKRDYLDSSIVVTPTKDTTYTLTAERGSRDTDCDVTVKTVESVVVLEDRDAQPLVAGIALSQVPHTGASNVVVYYGMYALMFLWAAALLFAVGSKKTQLVPVTVASDTNAATSFGVIAMKEAEAARPDLFPKY